MLLPTLLSMTLLAAWATISLAPETPIGRRLHRAMVERPAAWLGHIRPGHVMLVAIVVLVAGLAIHFGGGDAAAMLSPELLGWMAMVDIATYLDVAIALSVVAISVRLRPFAAYIAAMRHGRGASIRSARRRDRRARPVASADNDDGVDRRWSGAIAA